MDGGSGGSGDDAPDPVLPSSCDPSADPGSDGDIDTIHLPAGVTTAAHGQTRQRRQGNPPSSRLLSHHAGVGPEQLAAHQARVRRDRAHGERELRQRHQTAVNDLRSLNASVQARNVTASVRAVKAKLPGQGGGGGGSGAGGTSAGANGGAGCSGARAGGARGLPRQRVRLPSRPSSSAAGRRRSRLLELGLDSLPQAGGKGAAAGASLGGVDESSEGKAGDAAAGAGGGTAADGGGTSGDDSAAAGATLGEAAAAGGGAAGPYGDAYVAGLHTLPDFGLSLVAMFLEAPDWRAMAAATRALRRVLSPAFSSAAIRTQLVERGRVRLLRTRMVTALTKRLTRVSMLKVVGGALQPQAVPVFARTLPLWKQLEVLDLASCMVDDECLAAVADALPQLPQLAVLDLQRNMVGCDGAAALAAALPACPALEQVVVTENYVGDRGVVALARSVRECAALWSLRLAGNRHTSAATPWLLEAVRESDGRLSDLTM